MDTDDRQINQFFIGVSRCANRWLNLLRFLVLPWRSRRRGIRLSQSRPQWGQAGQASFVLFKG
jgi:hypothetical protein